MSAVQRDLNNLGLAGFAALSALEMVQILNGVFKLQDLELEWQINLDEYCELASEAVALLGPPSKSICPSTNAASSVVCGLLRSMVIVTAGPSPTLARLVTYCSNTLGIDPVIAQLRPLSSVPPWHSREAWYGGNNCESEQHENYSPPLDPQAVNLGDWDDLPQLLRRHAVPLVYILGLGIVPKKILAASRGPIVNLHNALLPSIRGLDSPAWSALAGIPAGATLHLIDTGVDTGRPLISVMAATDVWPPAKHSYTPLKSSIWEHAFLPTHRGFSLMSRPIRPFARNGAGQFYALHPKLRRLLTRNLGRVG